MPRASSVSGWTDASARRRPSFRDARARVLGDLRGHGWVWLLSMLWVTGGVVWTGYIFYITTQPYRPDLGIPGWSLDPVVVQIAVVLAFAAVLALPVPLLVAGFVRLRGWRRGNWLRAVAWASACSAGVALYALAMFWAQYPCGVGGMSCPYGSPALVSWGDLAICPAWLVLGAGMTWILARLQTHEWDLPETSDSGGRQARS
jgi:hypothetical protein